MNLQTQINRLIDFVNLGSNSRISRVEIENGIARIFLESDPSNNPVSYTINDIEDNFRQEDAALAFVDDNNQLQIIETVNSCEGRITNGAEIEEAFDWMREELESIFKGNAVNDTSLTR